MRVKSFQQFKESLTTDNIADDFKDINGKTPAVGQLIVNDDKTIGKIKRFFRDDTRIGAGGGRMEVDFRGHYLELNPNSEFEILENPDEELVKAFESQINESVKDATKQFLRKFRQEYAHLTPQISDEDVEKYLEQEHIKDLPLKKQMDLFSDYLLANDLAEVQE